MTDAKNPTRASFLLWQTIPVRAADMDARRHVNNATYLTYFEIARRPVFEQSRAFTEYEARGQNPVLVEQTCAYKRPLAYPATIDIGLAVGDLGTRSFTFQYGIFLDGEETLVAHGQTIHAWFDHATGKAETIPHEVRDALSSLGTLA